MPSRMSPELYWAIQTALMTAMLWAPHILQRIIEMGPYDAFRDPRHDSPTRAPWAQRAIRAHTNAVENLGVLAVLALSVHILQIGDATTAAAARLYFFARAAHYTVYVLGVPWLRTPLFLVGWGCLMVLGGRLLGLL